MIPLTKPLYALTATDLMKRPVVTLQENMFLKDAALLFDAEQIGGAPVVNEEGRCVGVLSTTDFMRREERGTLRSVPADEHLGYGNHRVIDVELLPHDVVGHQMSTEVATAPPSASIAQLARQMLDAHIHRVIIVDSRCHPIGIISSTDILEALAYHEFEATGS